MRNLVALDGEGDGVATAEAEGCDAALQVAALQFVEQGDEDARPTRADGMAEGDGAAVHVDLFRIEFELARDGNRGDGKGFIEFDEVDIHVAVPAGFCEELFDSVNGRHHHPLGLDAADGLRDNPRNRLFAEPRRIPLAGNNQCRRAVVRAGRVARSNCAVFLEGRLELRERLHARVFPRRFVVLDDNRIALFLRHFDRQNLRFEETGLARTHRFLVAFDGELVLLFASDSVFFRNQFAGHAHMKIFVSVPEAVVDHRVDELSIADAVAGSRLRQKIGTVGHGLHPARHYNFRFTKLHGLRGQRDSFEAGTANFIDGHGGNAGMAAAFERCLPRGILAEPRLYNVAENSFVNLLCLEARAADGFRDDLAAEFGSGESGETALELADRRSNGGEDDGSFRGHDEPPDESRALL